jgi:hypothetical protein
MLSGRRDDGNDVAADADAGAIHTTENLFIKGFWRLDKTGFNTEAETLNLYPILSSDQEIELRD